MKKRGGKQQSGTQCGTSTLLEIRELSMHTTASEPFRAGSLRKTMDMEGARNYIGPQLISSQKNSDQKENKEKLINDRISIQLKQPPAVHELFTCTALQTTPVNATSERRPARHAMPYSGTKALRIKPPPTFQILSWGSQVGGGEAVDVQRCHNF